MTVGLVQRLLVGDPRDPHLTAVAAAFADEGTVVLDAATVTDVVEHLTLDQTRLTDLSGSSCVLGTQPVRGWLRRLAPAGWDDRAVMGSKQAAVLASRMALLAGVIRTPSISWITPIAAGFAAENKLVQYRTARTLGLSVPDTTFHHDATRLAADLGEPFILKAMGPGAYRDDDDQQRVVYSRSVTVANLAGSDLAAAPFLAQRSLDAKTHLRIVTVGRSAWTSALDASGRPMDWREQDSAHDSFRPVTGYEATERDAVRLADALGCGYTSQDWIVDDHGVHFIDLNPGGQWLFLPQPTAGAVTAALAEALDSKKAA